MLEKHTKREFIMRKLRRTLSAFMAFAMLLAAAPVYVGAVFATTPEEGVSSVYLSTLTPTFENAANGYGVGTYDMIYAYADGEGKTASYDNSVFLHAVDYSQGKRATVSFDISEYTSQDVTFISKVGFLATKGTEESTGQGSARFYIVLDDVVKSMTGTIKPTTGSIHIISCKIPAGTKKLSLSVDPYDYDGTSITDYVPSYDWTCFYEPVITSDVFLSDLTVYEHNSNQANADFRYGTAEIRYGDGTSGTETGANQTKHYFNNCVTLAYGDVSQNKAGTDFNNPAYVIYDVTEYAVTEAAFSTKIGFLNAGGGENYGSTFKVEYSKDGSSWSELATNWDQRTSYALKELKGTLPAGTKYLKLWASFNPTVHPGLGWTPRWSNTRPTFIAPKITRAFSEFACDFTASKYTIEVGGTSLLEAGLYLAGEPVTEGYTVTYESSNPLVLNIIDAEGKQGMAQGINSGVATVTASITYGGKTYKKQLIINVTKSTVNEYYLYLSDLEYTTANNIVLDADSKGNKINFSNEGNPLTFDKGIFAHAPATIEFNIEGLYAEGFRAYAGINASSGASGGANNADVTFKVYADGAVIANTGVVTLNGKAVLIDVAIPEGTKILKLECDPGTYNWSDHSAWGDAKLVVDSANKYNAVKLDVDVSKGILSVGDSATASVSGKLLNGDTLTEQNTEIVYSSSNSSVFTVDTDGNISTVGNGTAYLNVTAGGKTVKTFIAVGTDEAKHLYRVNSPDGKTQAVLALSNDGKVYYAEVQNGQAEVSLSEYGVNTSIADFSSGLSFRSASSTKLIDEKYTLTARVKSEYHNHANEREFVFTKNGATFTVIVRAYNEGIALRYTVDSAAALETVLYGDTSTVVLPEDNTVWAMTYVGYTEEVYKKYENGSGMSGGFNIPLIVKNNTTGVYTTMTEADFTPGVPMSKYTYSAGKFLIDEAFDEVASTKLPYSSSWKLFITGTLTDISESSMVTDVSKSPDPNVDYSFVEPGVSSWSWISVGSDNQTNPDLHKKYIDLTSEMGWEYYTLDDGWQPLKEGGVTGGIYGKEYKEIEPGAYYSWTADLVEYAKDKNVKIIAWVHRGNLIDDAKMYAMLKSYADMGIAGIKVDFFNYENAETMTQYDKIYRTCAELGLVVNCHGANKPTGEVRKHPNILAREAIRGEEYWFNNEGGMQAEQYTIIPFIRGVAGPADVTEALYQNLNNKTTSGSQMALSVIVASGIHYLSSTPEEYRGSVAYDFYKDYPGVWDESLMLQAEIGEHVQMARRNGSLWYAGGITTNAGTKTLTLDFLDEDEDYYAIIYSDNTAENVPPAETICERRLVNKGDTLSFTTLDNGGYAVKLIKTDELSVPVSVNFGKSTVDMHSGEEKRLTVIEKADSGDVSALYVSSNNSVATISSDATVSAKATGTVTISAINPKTSEVYDTCMVKVNVNTAFESNATKGTVFYLSAGGNDSNNGLSKSAPVATLSKATALASAVSGEKTIMIIGEYGSTNDSVTLSADTLICGYDRTSKLTLNSASMSGKLYIDNIKLNISNFFNTGGKGLYIGEGVSTPDRRIRIHSGTQGSDCPREVVEINSGKFYLYSGTYYNNNQNFNIAGATYTFGGSADIKVAFRADSYLATHKGTVFTDTVNVINNGAKVSLALVSYQAHPVTFEKGIQLINNNNSATIVNKLALDTLATGFYNVYGGPGGTIAPTATMGTYTITSNDNMLALSEGKPVGSSITIPNGGSMDISFVEEGGAIIGTTIYDTLVEAVATSESGDTIVVAKNANITSDITIKSGVTLELGGFDITGAKVKLANGAVLNADKNVAGVLSSDDQVIATNVTAGRYSYMVAGHISGDVMTLVGGSYNAEASSFTYSYKGVNYTFTTDKKIIKSGSAYSLTVSDVTLNKIYGAVSGNTNITVESGNIADIYAAQADADTCVTINVNGGTVENIHTENASYVSVTRKNGGTITNLMRNGIGNTVNVDYNTEGLFFTGWDNGGQAKFTTLETREIQIAASSTTGLKFTGYIKDKTSVDEYGIVILPGKPAGGEITLESLGATIASSKDSDFEIIGETGEGTQYAATLNNIASASYNKSMTARAYLKYTVDGVSYTSYSDTITGNVIDTAKELAKKDPVNYNGLYMDIMEEYNSNFTTADEFKEKMLELSATSYKPLTLNFGISGYALSTTDGAPVAKSGYSITDFIAVENYEALQFCLAACDGVASVALYDSNKQFISCVTKNDDVLINQIDIPANAKYLRFTNRDGFTQYGVDSCNDVGKHLNEYISAKDSTSFAGKKIVCVGDGLTYGDYGTTVSGRGFPGEKNYPYFLAQYTGADVEWYACGGYTALALASDYEDGIFSGEGRPGVQVSVKDADYVIVMLGTNGGLSLVGDRRNYDAYLSLAVKLQNDVKEGAKIILMTPPHATEDETKVNYGYMPNIESAYPGVLKIAEETDVTIFDVYNNSGFGEVTEELMQPHDGLHLAGVGYSTLAAFVTNELKLLANDRHGSESIRQMLDSADTEFLSTVSFPNYVVEKGNYYKMGRWFEKQISGYKVDVTLNSGSEIFFLTNGAGKAVIDFVSMTNEDTAYYAVSIDGATPTRHPITEKTITLPDKGYHTVRVTMDGIYENVGKWNNEIGYAIKDIMVDMGRVRAIRPTDKVIFYYGDGITEGVLAMKTGANGIGNSAVNTYAYVSAKELEAIPFFVGYGATGVMQSGSFNTFINAIDYISNGRPQDASVTTLPDEIVINHGYNDGGADSTAFKNALTAALNRLNEKYPDTPIYYVIPFAQRKVSEIREVCAQFDNITVIETEGYNLTFAPDGIHSDANGGKVAGEKIAEAIAAARTSSSKYGQYITYRKSLQNTAASLALENKLNIAYYGGSITQGYGASDGNNTWRSQTMKWFSEKYPEATINPIYACMGESGTYLGTYLLDDYVIAKEPDLVFLEYAINDRYARFPYDESVLQCETIVRTIKKQLPKCDIVMLITIDESTKGENWNFTQAQAHAAVAQAYNIPIIYMGRALSDHIDANSATVKWSDYFIDIVHPTDAGYLFYTDVIFEYLRNSLIAKSYPEEYLPNDTLPEMMSDHLMDGDREVHYISAATLDLLDTDVWSYNASLNMNSNLSNKGSVVANTADAPSFTYKFNGTELALFGNIVNYTSSGGYPYQLFIDGDTTGSWGYFETHNPSIRITGLAPGEHTVTIKIAKDYANWGISTWYISAAFTRDASKQTVKGDAGNTITFMKNDGTTAVVSSSVLEAGSAVTPPAPPTRLGYFFKGWAEKADSYTVVDITTVTGDKTYYAIWLESGDSTGDGQVNILDAISAFRIIAGSKTLTEVEKSVADVNNDGVINIIDIIRLFKLISSF